jgi:hypothetical protein
VSDRPETDALDAHLQKLSAAGLLHVIDRPIDKDCEMHPLVRWQYRGGIPQSRRKAFLFTNVTDAKGRAYPGARVAIGALAATPEIYAVGLGKPVAEIGQAWLTAMAAPIAPRLVDSAPCQEVVLTGTISWGREKASMRCRSPSRRRATTPRPISPQGFGPRVTPTRAFRTSDSTGAISRPPTGWR